MSKVYGVFRYADGFVVLEGDEAASGQVTFPQAPRDIKPLYAVTNKALAEKHAARLRSRS